MKVVFVERLKSKVLFQTGSEFGFFDQKPQKHSGKLQQKGNFLEGYGDAYSIKVKAQRLGLKYPIAKWEDTCLGFTTTS